MVTAQSPAIAPFESIIEGTCNSANPNWNPTCGFYTIDDGTTWSEGEVNAAIADTFKSFRLKGESTANIDLKSLRLNFDVGQISSFTEIVGLNLANAEVSGEASFLANFLNLNSLTVAEAANFALDLSILSGLSSFKSIWANNTLLTGSLTDVGGLSFQRFYARNTAITGDLSALVTNSATTLTQLSLALTAITIPVSTLKQFTNLTFAFLSNLNIVGDINELATLTNISQLVINGATGATGGFDRLAALTKFSQISLTGLHFTQAQLDNGLEAFYNARATFTAASKTLTINNQTTGDTPSGTPGDPEGGSSGHSNITGLQLAGVTVIY